MSNRWTPAMALVAVLVLVFASAAFALDVWSGSRSCLPGEDLKVRSYASGTVKHYRDGDVTGSWTNTTSTWRTTYQGWQFQEVMVSATGALDTVQTSCVCLSGQCANGPSGP